MPPNPTPATPPLDYVIFHPERLPYKAEGLQFIDGETRKWSGIAWADRIPVTAEKNEDPYIWANEWLFSYCHATQLKRVGSVSSNSRVGPGSRLFFCSTPAARKHQLLMVDTVFKVARCMVWPCPGIAHPESHRFGDATEEYQRHFKHGIRGPGKKGHLGRFTYVAQMGGHSFLPLGADGKPFAVRADSVLEAPAQALKIALPANQPTKPIQLAPGETLALRRALEQTPTRVICIATRGKLRRADL